LSLSPDWVKKRGEVRPVLSTDGVSVCVRLFDRWGAHGTTQEHQNPKSGQVVTYDARVVETSCAKWNKTLRMTACHQRLNESASVRCYKVKSHAKQGRAGKPSAELR
jgi:hypothetical protein